MESAVSQDGSSGTPSSRSGAIAWMTCASAACTWARKAPGLSVHATTTQRSRLMNNERALRQQSHQS